MASQILGYFLLITLKCICREDQFYNTFISGGAVGAGCAACDGRGGRGSSKAWMLRGCCGQAS